MLETDSLLEEEKFSMAMPDKAWRTMVSAWEEVPKFWIVADIEHFEVALDAIIAAGGAYVSDHDLCNGHRRGMRRLVLGGAWNTDKDSATKELLREGLAVAMASWEGLTSENRGGARPRSISL